MSLTLTTLHSSFSFSSSVSSQGGLESRCTSSRGVSYHLYLIAWSTCLSEGKPKSGADKSDMDFEGSVVKARGTSQSSGRKHSAAAAK